MFEQIISCIFIQIGPLSWSASLMILETWQEFYSWKSNKVCVYVCVSSGSEHLWFLWMSRSVFTPCDSCDSPDSQSPFCPGLSVCVHSAAEAGSSINSLCTLRWKKRLLISRQIGMESVEVLHTCPWNIDYILSTLGFEELAVDTEGYMGFCKLTPTRS